MASERSSSEDLAWAAGFFDGEGNLRAFPNGYHCVQMRLTIQQVSREPLDRMVKALGVGYVRGPYHGPAMKRKHQAPIYQFMVTKNDDIRRAMQLMWPWLTEVKREQANRAFAKREDYEATRHLGERGSLSESSQA